MERPEVNQGMKVQGPIPAAARSLATADTGKNGRYVAPSIMPHRMRSIAMSMIVAASLASLAGQALAKEPDPEDIAFAMGMLWRVQEGLCPGASFDPVELGKLVKPKPLRPAEIKRRYKEQYDKGFSLASDAIADDVAKAYCDSWVTGFFGGTKDFYGGVRSVPEEPVRGLVIRK
ncbi:hypothetical protein SAMN05444161_5550 [Rhizobiales bacterium GAS191]|nr:hypothetical protein SAMN05519104_5474 [Rhizobiales bacterium GAS188]SEE36676.1 hypothetical protein SAMN05444161_5550 [Rhizobiales bacterium GAS191]